MAKIAAGLFNTHCKTGDARLETVAALAGAAGAGPELIRKILELKMAEEAVSLIDEAGLEECYDLMVCRTADRIEALWRKDYDHMPELHLYVLDLKGRQLNRITRRPEE
jgi:cobalamin biosynthesis protein CbiD